MDSKRTATQGETRSTKAPKSRDRRSESATVHELDKDHGCEAEQAIRIATREDELHSKP